MPSKSKLYPWIFYCPIYLPIFYMSLTYGTESGAFVPFYHEHQALCIAWGLMGCFAAAASLLKFHSFNRPGFTDLHFYLPWVNSSAK
jgi:hypothetical protein